MENNPSRSFDETKRNFLFEKIKHSLNDVGLKFDVVDQHGFRLPFGDEKKLVYVFVLVADSFLVIVSNNGLPIDLSKKAVLLDIINSWNTERPLGSFEIHKDGFLNYRYGIDDPLKIDSGDLAQRIFHCSSEMESRFEYLQQFVRDKVLL